jgi:transcriptional regulator with GAF, ATPase, and Fis domain
MTNIDYDNLGATMAELARTYSGTRTLEQTLSAVTASALDLIPGIDCADILMIDRKKYTSHAPTSALPTKLDAVQEIVRQGPCVDAADGHTVICSDDLEFESRWPRFTKAALEAGVRGVLSFQLYTRKESAGALNLFAFEPHTFDENAVATGEILAAHAAIAIVAGRKEHQFHSALASRDLIGQAKGMLMERFGVTADRAFELLTTLSQQSNTPLADLAADIVDRGPDSRDQT